MNTVAQTQGKHTPGPWKASFNGQDDTRIFAESVGDSPRAIARINMPVGRALENCRNAQLISAAPELLEALQLHLEFLKSLPKGWLGKTTGDIGALNDAYLKGNAALAKVEGKA